MGLPWHLAIAVPNVRWIECLPQVNGEMLPRLAEKPGHVKEKTGIVFLLSAVQCSYVLVSLASERVGHCGQGHYGDDCGCLAVRWTGLCLSPRRNVSGLDDVRRAAAETGCPICCSSAGLNWTSAGPKLALSYTST